MVAITNYYTLITTTTTSTHWPLPAHYGGSGAPETTARVYGYTGFADRDNGCQQRIDDTGKKSVTLTLSDTVTRVI